MRLIVVIPSNDSNCWLKWTLWFASASLICRLSLELTFPQFLWKMSVTGKRAQHSTQFTIGIKILAKAGSYPSWMLGFFDWFANHQVKNWWKGLLSLVTWPFSNDMSVNWVENHSSGLCRSIPFFCVHGLCIILNVMQNRRCFNSFSTGRKKRVGQCCYSRDPCLAGNNFPEMRKFKFKHSCTVFHVNSDLLYAFSLEQSIICQDLVCLTWQGGQTKLKIKRFQLRKITVPIVSLARSPIPISKSHRPKGIAAGTVVVLQNLCV